MFQSVRRQGSASRSRQQRRPNQHIILCTMAWYGTGMYDVRMHQRIYTIIWYYICAIGLLGHYRGAKGSSFLVVLG